MIVVMNMNRIYRAPPPFLISPLCPEHSECVADKSEFAWAPKGWGARK